MEDRREGARGAQRATPAQDSTRARFRDVRASIAERTRELAARLDPSSSVEAAEQRLRDEIEAHARERQIAVEAAESRLEDTCVRFVVDLSRLRAELDGLRAKLVAELSAERERLMNGAKEAARAAIEEGAADVRHDLERRVRELTAEVRGELRGETEKLPAQIREAGEQEARDRIAEAARTAQFRVEAADRAQERELRIRAATERAERNMERRVRAAEQRLLDLFERAAAVERSSPG